MKTVQALVAIGGRASRLRSGGIDVPISKSFLLLHIAGIKEVVLCADARIQLLEADLILSQASFEFKVRDFLDDGLGVHGLPYQARSVLDGQFIFECGHGVSEPQHYSRLDAAKRARNVVFSGFQPHPSNPRQPVALSPFGYVRQSGGWPRRYAVAHPMLVDQAYAATLPQFGFRIEDIIRHYSSLGRLKYVMSRLPPEFDLAEEMTDAMPEYENFLDRSPNLRS